MKLLPGHRTVRIPSPNKKDEFGTGILDKHDKLVAYSPYVLSVNDKNPKFEWVRKDYKS